MVAARDICEALSSMGITIEAHGTNLRYRPRSALTLEMLAAVKSYKDELLEILLDRSLLLEDLGGSGSRSADAASVAQVHHTTRLSKADIEFDRFARVAVPMLAGDHQAAGRFAERFLYQAARCVA